MDGKHRFSVQLLQFCILSLDDGESQEHWSFSLKKDPRAITVSLAAVVYIGALGVDTETTYTTQPRRGTKKVL